MPALTIRNIPEAALERLRARARRGHRSLNGEILAIIEDAAYGVPDEGPVFMPPVPLPDKPTFRILHAGEEPPPLTPAERERRLEKLKSLHWEDSRTTEEIIADIIGSRTMGREVDL